MMNRLRVAYNPPRDRTAEPSALGFPTCHLGSMKMTADMALGGVTKRVIVHRGSFFLPSTLFPQRLADYATGH